jgi:hypothetical protein
MATEAAGATQNPFPSLRLCLGPDGSRIWEIPDEAPGTLAEISAAEDSRCQNFVFYALRDATAFRRSAEAIGAALDPYELILAVQTCVVLHLNRLGRLADQRRRMRLTADRARTAAAPQEFLSSLDEIERQAWLWRLTDLGLSYPDDPRIMADLRNMAAGLDGMLARGAFMDRGGRPKMAAFERLVRDLARVFKDAAGRPAGLSDYRRDDPPRYAGQFWHLIEIIRPIVAEIISKSGEPPLAQPAGELARGRFIERVLTAARQTEAAR